MFLKTFILSLIVVALSAFANAQGKYKPGYIILNNGDTLSGEIEYNDWTVNPVKIKFRENGTQEIYSVGQLKGFSIEKEAIYFRFKITYQQSAADLNEATEKFDGPVQTEDAWLRLLYKADYSLYEFHNAKRKYFFIESVQEGLKELVYRVRVSNGQLQKDEQYKNLLFAYAGEKELYGLQQKINSASYNDKDLIRIFQLLNEGKSSYHEEIAQRTVADVSGGVATYFFSTTGALFNDGSGSYALNTASFKSSFGVTVGAGITYYAKRKNSRLQSRLGFSFSSVSLNGSNRTGQGSFQYEKYSGSLFIAEPNFNLMVKLTSEKPLTVLLGPSLGYGIVIKNNFSSRFENPGVVIEKKNFPPADGGFMKAGIDLGLISKRGRLNISALLLTNLFDSPFTTLRAKGIGISYGYLFKRNSKKN